MKKSVNESKKVKSNNKSSKRLFHGDSQPINNGRGKIRNGILSYELKKGRIESKKIKFGDFVCKNVAVKNALLKHTETVVNEYYSEFGEFETKQILTFEKNSFRKTHPEFYDTVKNGSDDPIYKLKKITDLIVKSVKKLVIAQQLSYANDTLDKKLVKK